MTRTTCHNNNINNNNYNNNNNSNNNVNAVGEDHLRVWSGYFKKNIAERQDLLFSTYPQLDRSSMKSGGLSEKVADTMVENCIGTMGLPVGVAPTFVINDRHYVVPMAVEEPSVIAAASGAAKLIANAGGFTAQSTSNIMTGQVQILDVQDLDHACDRLVSRREDLIVIANKFCASMASRGGGVVGIEPQIVSQRNPSLPARSFLVVHIHMDVCEAMGANAINTVCEGIAPVLAKEVQGRVGLRILSNLCLERRAKASFRIPFSLLSWKGFEGSVVAERIVEAYEFAESDPYRAVTHNKGVMNGIDAVAIATGQDWRAIEAAAHAFATRNGYYGSITSYAIEDGALVGSIEMPIAVGTVGGALKSHPVYKMAMSLLGNPSAQDLAQIIVAVGLAQNFAALRALATEGIQKGHMQLHARKTSRLDVA